jgi:uncharacterized protein YbcI
MTVDPERATDSRLGNGPAGAPALKISNAVGRVHKALIGRGPTSVKTHIAEDAVICVLEGGFTQAEQTVWEDAGKRAVLEMRLHLQDAMKPAIVDAVEAIVGRRVRSFMSANDPGNNVHAEILVLEPRSATVGLQRDGVADPTE